MSGKYYVYEHWRPDKDVCFYVGKGKGRRANVLYGRNQHHLRIQNKLISLGMCVEVRLVLSDLTAEEAYSQEMKRVSFWGAFGIELANKTTGGDGGSKVTSEETRQKMRNAKLGRKLTEEHKRKIGAASKISQNDPAVKEKRMAAMEIVFSGSAYKEKQSTSQKARVRTKEHYEKISAALKGRKLSSEHIEATRAKNLGRKQSKEEIENRANANSGKKRTQEFCDRMKASWTPERKADLALKMKGNEMLKKMQKINIGNKHTLGMKHTEETRAKMRASHALRLATIKGA